MPLNSDPGATVDITFKTVRAAPTFVYSFLTVSELFERKRHYATAGNLDLSDEPRRDAIFAALSVGLEGWRDLFDKKGNPIEYEGNADRIADALSWDELFDLYHVVLPAVRLAEADRKKSQPSSGSGQASTATPV